MRARSFKKYKSSFINILDLVGHFSGLVWNIAYLMNYEGVKSDLEENGGDSANLIAEIQK